MALTDWLMRIVSVSGLSEDVLTSGAAWVDEAVTVKETDEKKTITGIPPTRNPLAYRRGGCTSIGLYCPLPLIPRHLAKSSLTLPTDIPTPTRSKTYRTAPRHGLERTSQRLHLAKSFPAQTDSEMEGRCLGPAITDVSLHSTIGILLHQRSH